ncbi:uncharacterized protein LOC115662562 [Syzygium oleosum]|uniref:uncharacterized protein LOC115662562 n=1 Tax=Syzygium oleosum TaxID=219896 RepID=UPI0011D2C67D|nr:uncharacterized protein LOC115662562 [Syzygium oleosum]
MERWSATLKVPVHANGAARCCRVAVSLCTSPPSETLTAPSANAVFFGGDRAGGTGNPVVERLSDPQAVAEVLVSKFGGSVNAWVVEASTFNGPFAVYKEFVPSANKYGEPRSYSHVGFPASSSTLSLLSNCLEEAKNVLSRKSNPVSTSSLPPQGHEPKTVILGFSKGGTVLNQLVTELSHSQTASSGHPSSAEQELLGREVSDIRAGTQVLPTTIERFLNSIQEIHYVDVGLNSSGAYITDPNVIGRLSQQFVQRAQALHFVLHGTPRQWCDRNRIWICREKDRLLHLLKSESQKAGGKIQVAEKFYFADRPPNLEMHFAIIEKLDVSI